MQPTTIARIAWCLMGLASAASGAIDVGPGGTEVWTFDSQPAPPEWSTLAVVGNDMAILTPAELDAEVQRHSAASVTNEFRSTATIPPATASDTGARWNSNGRFVQMRPAGTLSVVLLMAVLQNNTKTCPSFVDVSYDFTSYGPGPDEVPGWRVYYSMSGTSDSWQLVPEISGVVTSATLRATLSLGSWAKGSRLYLLWADDNGQTTDPGYSIDNFIAVPQPGLIITRSDANRLDIAWAFPSTGYVLQSTSGLGAAAWTPVLEEDAPSGGFHHVSVGSGGGDRFFRLRTSGEE